MPVHFVTPLYVCVRRGKLFAYIYTEEHETIKILADKILEVINVSPKIPQISSDPNAPDKRRDDIQLRFPADVPLQDEKLVGDYGIHLKTGQTVYLLFKDENGDWEPINLYEPPIVGVEKSKIEELKRKYCPQMILGAPIAEDNTSSSSSSSSSSSTTTTADDDNSSTSTEAASSAPVVADDNPIEPATTNVVVADDTSS